MKRALALVGIVTLAALGTAAVALTDSKSDEKQEAIAEAATAPAATTPAEVRALEWRDLSPDLSPEAEQAAVELNLRIDQMSDSDIENAMTLIESEGNVLVSELDDSEVSLEGYLVPLDFTAEKAEEFVLVPYFGACIHVPPPPPNQIVYVKYREGLALSDAKMYSPFRVKGRIKAAHAKTDLANVGYQLTASDIEESEFE